MSGRPGRVIAAQRGLIAVWQMRRMRIPRAQIDVVARQLRRVHRGVYATGDLDELGWYLAAVLALGPGAAISRLSALMLLGLRPFAAGDIHVTVPRGGGRSVRDGIVVHRSRDLERSRQLGIPITSPTQALRDAPLARHELYRALEKADRQGLAIDRSQLAADVVDVQLRVRGRTRSDTEAAFVLLCRDHGLKLPLVNHRLNRCEVDFHWRDAGLVVEVDGFEHHRERAQFNEDRLRGLRHRVAGFEVVRVSADHVYDEPSLVVDALLAAAPSLLSAARSRPASASA
jgi:very-short-patch-repair endonuclease